MKKYIWISALVFVSNTINAHAQSVTLWGTNHQGTASGGACPTLHKQVSDQIRSTPEKTGVPNIIFAEGELPAEWMKESKNVISSSEDHWVRAYIEFYESIFQLSLSDDRLDGDPTFTMKNYNDVFSNYAGDLSENAEIKSYTQKILTNQYLRSYLEPIRGDIDVAIYKKPLTDTQEGYINFFRYLFGGYGGEKAKLKKIIASHIEFSREIAKAYFADKIQTAPKKYNFAIDWAGSNYNGKKIFDVINPSAVITETALAPGKNQDDIFEIMMHKWRDKLVFEKMVVNMRKYPSSNILLWIGNNHIKGLVKLALESKSLTEQEKAKFRVISEQTTPAISCNMQSVYNVVKNGKGSYTLADWNTKFSKLPTN